MSEVARFYDDQKDRPVVKRCKKGHLRLVKGKGEENVSSLDRVKASFERSAREWLAQREQKLQEDRDFIAKYGLNEWVVWRFKQDWEEYLRQLPERDKNFLSKDEAQKVIDNWTAQMKG